MPKAFVGVTLPIPIAVELERRAKAEGRSMSSVVAEALERYLLDKADKRKAKPED